MSRAASATTSAHDTVPGQAASSAALAASTTSSPPSDWFNGAASSVPRPSRSTNASHPYWKQSWK